MTDRLQEIRARLDAATPGPWQDVDRDDPAWIRVMQPREFPNEWTTIATCGFCSDARFIAHAPADIAWLLDEVARLTLQERSLKRIHADLQSRYQIATSEKKRGYTMDVRMVNDGRTF
jgi:hypothetical protein